VQARSLDAASPAWLLDVPDDEPASVETVSMSDGSPAIIVDEVGEDGRTTSTVILSRRRGLSSVISAKA
jgi:hypothetical protein